MLTQQQSWEYNRFKKLGTFFAANSSVYASFAPFVIEVGDFNDNFQSLENIVPAKTENATGITTDKIGLKHEVATNVALACRKTRSYALRFDQPELAAQTNINDDKIFRMKDADIMGYSASVVNLVTPLLTNTDYIPYGVSALTLDNITSLSTSFNDLIGKARQSESINTVANTAIDTAIDALRTNIVHFDLLVDQFEADNPEFVEGYHINSSVDNIGVHHSGIEGTVTDGGGQPLANATISLEGTTKTAKTDLLGAYRLERVRPDDYMVNISATGYAPQQVLHHISRGRIDELDFQLAASN